ncbi:MAG: hypothetical protein HUJ51_05040 [Eggerthellaceae bacterium]|nr:hypothetical protein [Eggerthellaceae bacterium]
MCLRKFHRHRVCIFAGAAMIRPMLAPADIRILLLALELMASGIACSFTAPDDWCIGYAEIYSPGHKTQCLYIRRLE